MPSTLKRLTYTRGERVEHILREAHARLPGVRPAEALLRMAERGIAATPASDLDGLIFLPRSTSVDLNAVEDALVDY